MRNLVEQSVKTRQGFANKSTGAASNTASSSLEDLGQYLDPRDIFERIAYYMDEQGYSVGGFGYSHNQDYPGDGEFYSRNVAVTIGTFLAQTNILPEQVAWGTEALIREMRGISRVHEEIVAVGRALLENDQAQQEEFNRLLAEYASKHSVRMSEASGEQIDIWEEYQQGLTDRPEYEARHRYLMKYLYHNIMDEHNKESLPHVYSAIMKSRDISGPLGYLVATQALKGVHTFGVFPGISRRANDMTDTVVDIANNALEQTETFLTHGGENVFLTLGLAHVPNINSIEVHHPYIDNIAIGNTIADAGYPYLAVLLINVATPEGDGRLVQSAELTFEMFPSLRNSYDAIVNVPLGQAKLFQHSPDTLVVAYNHVAKWMEKSIIRP